ncbi:Atxe2 family lasso peptide isopeptidase [Sphingomonas oryzagri]
MRFPPTRAPRPRRSFPAAATCYIAAAIVSSTLPSIASARDTVTTAPSLRDIVETRSIDGLTLSPDGQRVAFRILSPSVERNDTTAQWYVADLRSGAAEQVGGVSQPARVPIYDVAEDGQARWSPDGRGLFVLSLTRSQMQVHRMGPGSADQIVTHDEADIASFAITANGRAIRYQTGMSRASIAALQADDERFGIHLDRTVATEGLRLTRNFLIGNREVTIRRTADGNARIRGADPHRDVMVPLQWEPHFPSLSPRWKPAATLRATEVVPAANTLNLDGDLIELRPVGSFDSLMMMGKEQLTARHADGSVSRCEDPACLDYNSSIRLVTTSAATHEVIFAHEADFAGRTAIYGWRPSDGQIRLIVDPGGSLDGGSEASAAPCIPAPSSLLCVYSAPTSPPELVRIDVRSGRMTTVFDPNGTLRRKHYPRATFLSWKDSEGRSATGVLILPDDVPPNNLPLVITTYHCRGFLEGGTGRLAPELPLAERGFAVLCVNNNNATVLARDANGAIPPLGMHKAALDAYQAAIGSLAKRGLIDPNRVGIAGHSFSANIVAYGISHTTMFAAAVLGTGVTIDPASYFLTAPTADSFRKDLTTLMGLPAPDNDPASIWPRISPALNAMKVATPLLLQPPESEYLLALQLYAYLQDQGRPVDMYVYPREGHAVERWPVHQFLRAERSIDWFTRWLMPTR